jgi:large subunit ribosomal protein L23
VINSLKIQSIISQKLTYWWYKESIKNQTSKNKIFSSNNAIKIVKSPLITSKTTRLIENNKYSFIVNSKSNKNTIKKAIEYLFHVKVIKVNTCHFLKNKKQSHYYKKAIVTLSGEDKISLFSEN